MSIQSEADHQHNALKEQTVAIVGYGSQGKAHAHNLRDSGQPVIVGARRDGASWQRAKAAGFEVRTPAEAAAATDLVALLTPDMAQPAVYTDMAPHLRPHTTVLFAHGFNVHFGQIQPAEDLDVVLVAPKGPGDLVRREYQAGHGVPCLRAVFQDASGQAADKAMSYAHGIGGTRGGVIDTSFQEETETDLFGEQAVLCGGMTALAVQGFETLVDAGYQPEVAYFECLHELKLIVDLLHEGGLSKMYEFISETATYGDLVSGPRVVGEDSRQRMREVLDDIQSGRFARDWVLENQAGLPQYQRLLTARKAHPVETVGARLRARMNWLQADQASDEKGNDKADGKAA